MNTETKLTAREAVPVTIGPATLFCEEFRVSSSKKIADDATVNGEDLITSAVPGRLELTFKGRVYDESFPMNFILYIANIIRTTLNSTITYRGLIFQNCNISSFEAEDFGEDHITVSVTLYTLSSISRSTST